MTLDGNGIILYEIYFYVMSFVINVVPIIATIFITVYAYKIYKLTKIQKSDVITTKEDDVK